MPKIKKKYPTFYTAYLGSLGRPLRSIHFLRILADVDRNGPRRPVVPLELAGKWLAWSAGRRRILGHGDGPEEALAMAGGGDDLVLSYEPPADRDEEAWAAKSAMIQSVIEELGEPK